MQVKKTVIQVSVETGIMKLLCLHLQKMTHPCFNLLEYYKYYTNDKYAEFHSEYNFKGFILNKIPLLNKLNFHTVIGAKGLFTNKKPYTELRNGKIEVYSKFPEDLFFRAEFLNLLTEIRSRATNTKGSVKRSIVLMEKLKAQVSAEINK